MHELSLATSLVEQVKAILREQHAKRVLSVSVSLGAFSGVDRGALEFCFPLACEGTALEGARLLIEELPVKVLCGSCGKKTKPALPILECASCKGRDVRIVEGRDFLLKSMEVE